MFHNRKILYYSHNVIISILYPETVKLYQMASIPSTHVPRRNKDALVMQSKLRYLVAGRALHT